ncbi:MAG: hypothetical protein ACNI3A_19005 [Desulfovibrio sp.]|uniref:hypothetical protein n=1 Tax=Desulfovibrio sp. 7SRBS1 TaxID=3378064 RepID=UPI003B41DE43
MQTLLFLVGLFILVKIAEKRMFSTMEKERARKGAFYLWLAYTAFGLYLIFKGYGVS